MDIVVGFQACFYERRHTLYETFDSSFLPSALIPDLCPIRVVLFEVLILFFLCKKDVLGQQSAPIMAWAE